MAEIRRAFLTDPCTGDMRCRRAEGTQHQQVNPWGWSRSACRELPQQNALPRGGKEELLQMSPFHEQEGAGRGWTRGVPGDWILGRGPGALQPAQQMHSSQWAVGAERVVWGPIRAGAGSVLAAAVSGRAPGPPCGRRKGLNGEPGSKVTLHLEGVCPDWGRWVIWVGCWDT